MTEVQIWYTILMVVSCVFAILRGWEQAILWSRLGADSYSWNEHLLFVGIRSIYLITILLATQLTIIAGLFIAGAFILSFAFFHDGMYYEQRYQIDNRVYRKRWWSNPSLTTTSKIKFTSTTRIVLALIGLGVFIAGLFVI